MKFIKKTSKNIYVLSLFFTILILLTIFLVKGIYPFGHNTISNGDLNQSYITFYHYLYDIFHNGKSIFYNFELGMGSNIYGGFVSDGFFNPTSWLILFSSRANILYNMTFIVMIKFIMIALFTTIFIQKVFPKVDNKMKLLGILMYTFSGYIFINYSNIMWLDIVALFPLFCLGIYNILKFNKMTLFTVVLAFCLINNYNLAYMILFFIFFAIPFLIKYKAENKRKATMQIIIGTILSIGISAFAFIPTFLQAMSSYRMSGMVKNHTENVYFFYKLFNGLFYSLPFIYLFFMLKDVKKDNNIKCIIGIILTTFLIPVLFERINLLWHAGSYQCFGFRYGFIINFVLMVTLLYGYQKYGLNNFEWKIKDKNILKINWPIAIISLLFLIPSIILFIIEFINYPNPIHPFSPHFDTTKQLVLFLTIFFTSLFIYIYLCQKKKINYMIIFTIILIVSYGCSFLGHKDSLFSLEYSDNSILNGVALHDQLDIKDNYRIKDSTVTMTENYPLVADIASPSTFLHIISQSQVENYFQLGYSGRNTKLNDLGGTLLSDTIYGMKYIISKEEINNPILKFYKKVDDYFVYSNPYTKFIYLVDNSLNEKIEDSNNYFQANNILISELFHNEKLLKELDNNCTKEGNTITCKFDLNNEELYFYSNKNITEIKVNEKIITIPYISTDNNTNYLTKFHRILDLGYFDSKVTITFHDSNITSEDIHFSVLNMNDYVKVFDNLEDVEYSYKGNKLSIHYNNVNNYKGLFIPINYDTGFKGKRNNEDINIQKKLNNYIYLELVDGENSFELEYYPPTFKVCLLTSIVASIIISIIYLIERKRKKDKEYKFITIPFYILGIIILIGTTLKIYILPIIQTIIGLF